MPENTDHRIPAAETAAERRARLLPLLGEANLRELEAPVTEAERQRLAEIVSMAPPRVR